MKLTLSILVAAAAAVFVAACQATPSASEPLTGTWGGDHVRLELTAAGGVLEYDCAEGAIAGPVLLNSSGRFSTRGTHTPGQGGPAQIGETPRHLPADYAGRVRGARMTLDVRTSEFEIGSFTLQRDVAPRLFRCL